MAFKLPWSNFHELNLDWLLEEMKELETKVDNLIGGATPSTATPSMDGVGDAGSSINYARGDHVHPTDTSRASASDLSALDTREYNNYVTLNADINTVDAKIAFSPAAPQMDGVASPGSSAYQARADHVHPTDTSRASQTQVDTLQATVDSWIGSAYPYANNPEMDGVASPGDVAAYARGNHVHPSDTSRLATAGGTITGDLTIQGKLLQDGYAAYAATTAPGWLRVAEVPRVPGTSVEIRVNKHGESGQPAEVHKIIMNILRSTVTFVEEESAGDALHVNKIRYSDAERVDIHVDQSVSMSISFTIRPTATSKTELEGIVALTPEYVNDAPDGETIVTEYTFLQNTTATLAFTYGGKTWKLKRMNGVVSLSSEGNIAENISNGGHTMYTLPVGWRPFETVRSPIANAASHTTTCVQVSGNGPISFVVDGSISSGDPCAISCTWVTK